MTETSEKFSRQSFLGSRADGIIQRATVGVVGLGGGGSHVVQQLAHLGFRDFVLYDPDVVEHSNLNRLVGASERDADDRRPKVDVAERLVRGLEPQAAVRKCRARWQDSPQPLRGCDVVFGCVDGFAERGELETCARRYLIPLIDIGMDVNRVEGQPPRMAGQVILSMPGGPCMRCLGFLNDQTLTREAAQYGAAGPRPQVVWPNGVLASTAVGIAVDLLTDWSQSLRGVVYLSYDGNRGTVGPHPRLPYVATGECPHFDAAEVGDPTVQPL